MARHFGVFQFKEGVTAEEIEECFAEMRAMVGLIPGLLSMENGPYKSDEGLDDGYTHGFIMTFDSAASRDAYLPHPEHMKRVGLVQPKLERLVVFDFDVTPENSAQL
jgi:hypothetical protein